MDWEPVAVASTAAAAYVAVSALVGEVFPFSRYAMYADLRGRTEGAVLYVRAGEEFVPVDALTAFAGVDPAAIKPDGFPCSQEWAVWEARRWVEKHRVTSPAPGAAPVELGFRLLRIEQGRLAERLVPLASGWAKRR